MSDHDQHLPPRKIRNKRVDHEPEDAGLAQRVAHGQGEGTKIDAKLAVAATWIGKWGKRK